MGVMGKKYLHGKRAVGYTFIDSMNEPYQMTFTRRRAFDSLVCLPYDSSGPVGARQVGM